MQNFYKFLKVSLLTLLAIPTLAQTVTVTNNTPTICSGDDGEVRVVVTGGVAPYDVTYTYTDGGTATVSTDNAGDVIISLPSLTTNPNNFEVTSIEDDNNIVTPITTNNTATIEVIDNPTGSISLNPGFNEVCEGEDVEVLVTMTAGEAPFNIVISVNGANTNHTINSLSEVITFSAVAPPFTIGNTNNIKLESASYTKSGATCSSVISGPAQKVLVKPAPSAVLAFAPSINTNASGRYCESDLITSEVTFTSFGTPSCGYEILVDGVVVSIGSVVGASSSTNTYTAEISHTLNSLANPSATLEIRLTGNISANNAGEECEAPTTATTGSITVHQLPDVDMTDFSNDICNGALFDVTTTRLSGIGTINYDYTYNGGTQSSSFAGASEVIASFPYVVGDEEIVLVKVSDDNCDAYPNSVQGELTVLDRPTADINSIEGVCVNDVTTFTIDFTGTPDYDFEWEIQDAGDATVAGPFTPTISTASTTITIDPNALGLASGVTYTFVATSLSDANCASVPATDFNIQEFDFNVYDLPDVTVVFDQTQLCAQGGDAGNIDDVVATFTFSNGKVPFTLKYNESIISDGDTTTTLITDVVSTVNGAFEYTKAFSPNDTTIYALVSVVDSNGCELTYVNPTLGANQVAQVDVKDVPSVVVTTNTLAVCEDGNLANALTQINFHAEFTGSGAYRIFGEVRDETGTFLGSFNYLVPGGNNGILDVTLSDIETTSGLTFSSATDYQIVFTEVRDANNSPALGFPPCDYAISPEQLFTVHVIPTPTFVSVTSDDAGIPNRLCKGESAVLSFTFGGLYDYLFTLSKEDVATGNITLIGEKLKITNGSSLAGDTIYPFGIAPTAQTRYFIDEIFLAYDGDTCSVVPVGAEITIDVDSLPVLESFSLDKSTICVGEGINVSAEFSGVTPPTNQFDFDLFINNTSYNTYNNIPTSFGPEFIPSAFLTDTSYFSIRNLKSVSGEQCSAIEPLDSVKLNINQLVDGEILTNKDTVFCFDQTPGFYVELSGYDNVEVTFTVIDEDGTPLPNVIETFAFSNSNYSTESFLVSVPGVPTGTALTYAIASLSDGNSPSCINAGPFPEAAHLVKNIQPTVSLTGPMTVCPGAPNELDLKIQAGAYFAGGHNHRVAVASEVSYINGGVLSANTRINIDTAGITYKVPFSINSDTTFEVTQIEDQFGCVADLTNVNWAVDVIDSAKVTMSAFDTICSGTDVDVMFSADQSGIDYDITIEINGGAPINETIQDGDIIPYTLVDGDNIIVITTSGYGAGPACTITLNDTLRIFQKSSPVAIITNTFTNQKVCEGDVIRLPLEVTSGEGVVTIEVSDNLDISFNATIDIVAGEKDTLDIVGLPVGNYDFYISSVTTTSNSGICNGTTVPSDASFVIEQSPSATFTTSDPDLIVCSGELINFDVVISPVNAADYRIIYNINGGTDDTVVVNVGSPSFLLSFTENSLITFTSIEEIGVTPACSGTLTSDNQFNFTVNPRPSVAISGDTDVCEEVGASLNLDFEGTAPYIVDIDNGVGTFTASQDTTIIVFPSSTVTYQVTSLSDASTANCATAGALPNHTVNVVTKPDVVFATSDSTVCDGQKVDLLFNIDNTGIVGSTGFNIRYRGVSGTVSTLTGVSTDDDILALGIDTIKTSEALNGNQVFTLVSIEDGSNPRCTFNYNQDILVEVGDGINVNLTAFDTEVCEGDNVDLQAVISGTVGKQAVISISPINGGAFIDTVSANTTINLTDITPAAGTINYVVDSVKYLTEAYCKVEDAATEQVIVNPAPDASIGGNYTICNGQTASIDLDILAGSGNVTVSFSTSQGDVFDYTGTVGNHTVTFTPTSAGTVSVVITNVVSSTPGAFCNNTSYTGGTATVEVKALPTATIDADQTTIVNGGTANLIFEVSGPGNLDDVSVEYAINGSGGNFVDDGTPNTVIPNATYQESVSPIVTSTYSIVAVRQGASPTCVTMPTDQVTINVVSGVVAAVSGTGSICQGESVDIVFSFADNTKVYTVIVEDQNGNQETFTGVTDNTPITFSPSQTGTLNFNIISVVSDDNSVNTQNTADFAGAANYNVSSQKTITMYGDTIGCEGQNLPVFFGIEGSGDFTISFRNRSVSGVSRTFTASENDSPVQIFLTPSELRLGLNEFDFSGIKVTNSLGNTCPIDTVGSATIFVKPTPSANLQLNPAEVCAGSPVSVELQLTPDSTFNVYYRVDSANTSLVDTAKFVSNGGVIANFIPTQDVRYTLFGVEYADLPKCRNNTIVSKQVSVTPEPEAEFVSFDANICAGEEASVTVKLTADKYPVTFILNDGSKDSTITVYNANAASDTTIKVSPVTPTTYTIHTVIDGNTPACTGNNIVTIDIDVSKTIIFNNFEIIPDSICSGDPAVFNIDVDGEFPITGFMSDGSNSFTVNLTSSGPNSININPTPFNTTEYTLFSIQDNTPAQCNLTINQKRTLTVRSIPQITIIPDANEICLGDSLRVRVVVNAENDVDFNLRDQVNNYDVTYTDIPPGTQFIYIHPRLNGINTFSVDSIRYSDGKFCSNYNAEQFSLQANPKPFAFMNVSGDKDTTVCEGQPVAIDFFVGGTGTKTVFYGNDRGFNGSFVHTGSNPNRTILVNPYPEVGDIKYFIQSVTSQNGIQCDSTNADTILVRVSPIPTVEITADLNPRCLNEGTQTNLKFNFNGNGPFEFDYTDGQSTFTLNAISDNDGDGRPDITVPVSPGQTTTYQVTRIKDATNPFACVNNTGNAFTLKVLQSPEAEIFNNNDVICEGESILLEFFLRGKGPLDIVITESTGTTFPLNGLSPGYNTLVVTPPVPTGASLSANYSYIITSITDANNPTCSATGTGAATVLVNTTPELVSYTLVEDSICLGESINIEMEFTKGFGTFKTTFSANGLQLIDTVNAISVGAPDYEGTITTSPVVDTEYRPLEILDLATGCASTYSPSAPGKTVKVFKNPTATFNILESSVCDGDDIHLKVEFTGQSPFVLNGVFINGSGTPVPGTSFLTVKTDNDGDALADTTIAINMSGIAENSYFTFGDINDGRNLNGRGFGCSSTPKDTLKFTVNPTPTAEIGDLTTITVCEGDTATFPIDITGNGEVFVLIDISKNGTYLRTDSISGFSANSPLMYADQTVYSGVFITYQISQVYAIKGNLRCDGTTTGGLKTINYKALPRVTLNVANNTVCEEDATQVDFTFTGIGGFDFYYVMGEAPNLDTVEFFNEPNFVTDFINFTDSTVLYVPWIMSRSNPQCVNTDSVGIKIDVNKKATATFVDPAIKYDYCEDEQPGFWVNLTGEGLITVQYRAQPSGTIGVFQANEGMHFVEVNQFANTSQRYRIENLSDESNPFCVSTSFPDYIDISVYPRPQATLSGDFDACFGETSTVNIALTGSFQDSIIVYFSDKLNGVIDTSFAAKTGVYSMPLAPTDSVRLTIDSIAYVNLGCMVNDPALINQDTAIINIRPTPTVDISIDNIDQCINSDLSFVFDFEYDGPYNISYRVNGGSPINDDDVDDGHIALIPNVTDSILLEVTSLSYRTIPFCTADNVGSLFVNVNDSLRVDVTDTLCTDVATGFGLELNITGGQPSTYLYNEFLSLNPVDTTPFIPNGPFNILISDSSGCPPVRIIGDHTCDCISFAGTFNDPGAAIELCEDALLDLTAGAGQYQNDFIKDANDTLVFVMHDNSGATLGNIFATSSTPKFGIAPGIVPGLSYYITAVVADSVTGGGFNNMDRCLSLSNSIEFIFLERSTLEIELLTNDSGAVCVGDILNYRFRFDGTGPFDVNWVDGTGPQRSQTFVAGVSPVLTSNNPVTNDDKIDIQMFVDNGNSNVCYTVLNDTLPYVANPLPDASFTPSALAACGFDTVEFVIDNPVAGTRYFWTFENGLKELEGATVKYAFTQDGPGLAEVTAISATGCISTDQVIIAITLPQRPLITIDNQDPTSPSGIFCRQDVLQFVANATLFDKINWVVDGASVQNTTNPTYTPSAYERAGVYQVVAINEYNGCFNSDTATFEIQGPSAGVDVPDPICVDTEGLFSLTDMDDVAGATWSFSGTTTDAGIDGISFTYSFDEGFPSNDRVDVSLTLRSTAGCTFDTLFDITVYDLDVQLQQFNDQNNALEHCAGIEDKVVPYTATSPFDPDINSLLYNFGDGQSEAKTTLDTVYHTYNVPGDYIFSVTVQDINGCVDTDSLKYTIFAKPNVQLDDDSACFDSFFEIVARGADRYVWSPLNAFEIDPLDGNTALVRTDSVANYQVQVIGIDGNECRDTAVATIKMFDLLNPINNPKLIDIDTTHNIGYELSPDYELGDNRYIYTWTDDYEISCVDCPLPTMTNLEDTTYVLTVTDIYGCYTNQISVTINLNRETSVDVPDAFTPNGDGVNDWIYPDGWAFESVVEFSVFNRYGQLIWKGEGTNGNAGTASWDGTYKGKVQANDTYTYRAVIKTILGTEEIKTGSFEIIKSDLAE